MELWKMVEDTEIGQCVKLIDTGSVGVILNYHVWRGETRALVKVEGSYFKRFVLLKYVKSTKGNSCENKQREA